MRWSAITFGLSVFAAGMGLGQDSEAVQLPEFEVASIKRTDPTVVHNMGAHVYPGGRLEILGVSFKGLVATAFGLAYWQISGGEAWTEKESYDIEAKPPENLRSSIKSLRYSWYEIRDAQLRAMLQSLLISRFQLEFHRETKTGNVYLLQQSGKSSDSFRWKSRRRRMFRTVREALNPLDMPAQNGISATQECHTWRNSHPVLSSTRRFWIEPG